MLINENPPLGMISLRGAHQNNLQGIDLDFPLGKLTVICGVSGSGKTSLALDTLYAEGQRRYIESFSAYTRQFLQRIDKPQFDSLTNLPPSIAITREQRSRNNRSTVGTASEMLEYLRIVFAKHAELNCYQCHRKIEPHTPKTVTDFFSNLAESRAMIGFEISWNTKKDLSEQLFDLQTNGFVRLVTRGTTIHLADDDRQRLAEHFTEDGFAFVIVDRVKLGGNVAPPDRVAQSLEIAFEHADSHGRHCAIILSEAAEASSIFQSSPATVESSEQQSIDGTNYRVHRFSAELRCEHCKIDYPASEPRLFSFNNPIGACETCEGFGETISIDMAKVVPDKTLSVRDGAIAVWRTPAYSHELEELLAIAAQYSIPVDVPVSKIKDKHWKLILEGVPEKNFGGLNGFFAWLERKKYKMHIRAFLARWRTYLTCSTCGGQRLNRGALAYRVGGKTFADLCDLTIDELGAVVSNLAPNRPKSFPQKVESENQKTNGSFALLAAEDKSQYMASEPMRQVASRIEYLKSVGLGYVCLSRPMHTLSSGEAQRVMMTTLLGSSLVDMLYVFDEPTVGLHPQDTERMANAILGLRDRGNTVILVEHEPYLMRIADLVIEIGPQAGELGGQVTFHGTPSELLKSNCETGRFLSGERTTRRHFRSTSDRWVELYGASGRNLQSVDLRVPLGCLTVMAGPSGAGKSTLVLDTLCPAINHAFGDNSTEALPFVGLKGTEQILGCVAIDQSPIQRSSRSCPATYAKAMDDIRKVFAETPDAKSRRFGAGHFSFNSEIGRCATCEGLGYTTVDMQFLADVQLPCTDCDGKRFRSEVLEVRYRDLNIAEVLDMSVAKAQLFFRGCGNVQNKLKPLLDLGLGYLPLGQSLGSISAGESMRLKLASYLESRTESNALGSLIVMDEPTTGLHFSDVERLIVCIDILIDGGNSVLVIEHNEQMIQCADHIIEMGPGPGVHGGRIVKTVENYFIPANKPLL